MLKVYVYVINIIYTDFQTTPRREDIANLPGFCGMLLDKDKDIPTPRPSTQQEQGRSLELDSYYSHSQTVGLFTVFQC